MRQILPGHPQPTRQALCTANWDGLRLIAYISGQNAIIFNGRREVLQNITVDDADDLRVITVEEQSGRIALGDKHKVYLYEPAGRDSGDLHWNQSAVVQVDSEIHCISWASEEELLVAGQHIGLWRLASYEGPQKIWQSDLANTIFQALVSPDGALIASIGEYDRVVKIWRRLSWEQDSTRFDVSYIRHTTAVLNCMWRKPWYSEQSLDNLLYTFGSDDCVRVWAHADHHAYCAMQEVACIDLSASIQPRRMSVGSVSGRRFAFIVHSRDLSFAAERTLQVHRQGTEHALEHLIEIANRSPEVCVVLDGLGHMSVIGLENAGHKHKRNAELFNIALVDHVDLALPTSNDRDDRVIIHAFANSDVSASLCVLVQSYAGQIDWYQGKFVDFFDTARRENRVSLQSSWAGHAANIDGIKCDYAKKSFVSWTSDRSALVWHQQRSGILVPGDRISLEADVVCARPIATNLVLFLHSDSLTLWRTSESRASLEQQKQLDRRRDDFATRYEPHQLFIRGDRVIVLYEDEILEQYQIYSSTSRFSHKQNGYHEAIRYVGRLQADPEPGLGTSFNISSDVPADPAGTVDHLSGISVSGELRSYKIAWSSATQPSLVCADTIPTTIHKAEMLIDSTTGYVACIHRGGYSMSIWSKMQHSQELIHAFPNDREVSGLEWTQHRGCDVLLAWFDHSFCAITKSRYSDGSSSWIVHEEVRVREHTTYVINAVCWLSYPRVAVAAGNQILVFDAIDDARAKQAGIGESALTQAILPTCPLPIFHPVLLSGLLSKGDLAKVELIFVEIHEQTKFISDVDYLDPLLHLELPQLTRADSKTSQQRLEKTDVFEHADGVNRIPAMQLSDAGKADLSRLIKTTSQLRDSIDSLDHLARIYWQWFLTLAQDTPAFDRPVPYSAILAATLSQTPESLLEQVQSYLTAYCPSLKLNWSLARKLGLFLFLPASSVSSANPETTAIKDLFEQIARNEYNNPRDSDNKSPVDCSLYYLALSKKPVLQSLWRRTIGVREKDNTMRLLANDFSESRWKATALKNAYALLSKRRFEYAAAFFLLGGALNDAVNICINQLDDLQLGIAVARVWHDEVEGNRVMQHVINGKMQELALNTHEARFLLAWGRVQLSDSAGAVRDLALHVDVLLRAQLDARAQAITGGSKSKLDHCIPECLSYRANEPTILLELYKHLRHALHAQGEWVADSQHLITPSQEWSLVLRCVDWYRRAGLDILALALVQNWEFVEWQDKVVVTDVAKSDPNLETHHVDDVSGLEDMLSTSSDVKKSEQRAQSVGEASAPNNKKPTPTQFVEPSADSLLDSFGF